MERINDDREINKFVLAALSTKTSQGFSFENFHPLNNEL